MQSEDLIAARKAVQDYARARLVDPWSNKQLVILSQQLGDTDMLIGALTALDENEQATGRWAFELAKLHAKQKRWPAALADAKRAIQREPYNADYRENAATMALMDKDMDAAMHQIRALTMLEPDRSIHWARLAALSKRMGQKEQSISAAKKAIALDPNSPAKKLLD